MEFDRSLGAGRPAEWSASDWSGSFVGMRRRWRRARLQRLARGHARGTLSRSVSVSGALCARPGARWWAWIGLSISERAGRECEWPAGWLPSAPASVGQKKGVRPAGAFVAGRRGPARSPFGPFDWSLKHTHSHNGVFGYLGRSPYPPARARRPNWIAPKWPAGWPARSGRPLGAKWQKQRPSPKLDPPNLRLYCQLIAPVSAGPSVSEGGGALALNRSSLEMAWQVERIRAGAEAAAASRPTLAERGCRRRSGRRPGGLAGERRVCDLFGWRACEWPAPVAKMANTKHRSGHATNLAAKGDAGGSAIELMRASSALAGGEPSGSNLHRGRAWPASCRLA
jgi:hypothetical protein